jgi:hypothetical protein
MINDIDEDDALKNIEEENKYRIKNEYNWKKIGGHKILNDSEIGSSFEESSSDPVENVDVYDNNLFGPIGLKQCEITKEKGESQTDSMEPTSGEDQQQK